MKEIEGIVIQSNRYREKDKMVSVLTADGIYSFLARGTMKLDSKNRPSVEILTQGRYLLSYTKDGLSLRQGETIFSLNKARQNFVAIRTLSFIEELTYKFITKDIANKIYDLLLKILQCIEDGNDCYTLSLIYLAKVIEANGYGLFVDGCVRCGSKENLVALSYIDGGFVCRNDYRESEDLPVGERKLKIIRYIFKVGQVDLLRVSFAKEECLELIRDLCSFFSEATSTRINSIKLL